MITGMYGQQADTLVSEKIDIEVNAMVKYSGDNGTIIIDRDTPRLFELKTDVDFQEGNIYTFFLIVSTDEMENRGTIPAEIYTYTKSIEQTKLDIAKRRELVVKKNRIKQKREQRIN
jgi:hypothetical protein